MKELELYPIEIEGKTREDKDLEKNFVEDLGRILTEDLAGKRIGITVGSRGIKALPQVLTTIIKVLKDQKANPFLISSMGSHGGGTVEGQKNILKGFNITDETMGVPILISEQWLEIDPKVYVSSLVLDMDGIIVVNRVKPHTSFSGHIESGLSKMLVVGLGGPPGASAFHNRPPSELSKDLEERAQVILTKVNILAGVGIIEDSRNRIALLDVYPKDNILEGDKSSLMKSREYVAKIPVDEADILIIEEMGKNFSGTGMDTKVIGRYRIPEVKDPEKPNFKRIIVKDLSKESKGNASGIGLADFTLKDLLSKVDWSITYKNVIASTFLMKAMIPIVAQNGEEALNMALESLSLDLNEARIVVIKNTLDLENVWVTKNLVGQLESPNIKVKTPIQYLF